MNNMNKKEELQQQRREQLEKWIFSLEVAEKELRRPGVNLAHPDRMREIKRCFMRELKKAGVNVELYL